MVGCPPRRFALVSDLSFLLRRFACAVRFPRCACAPVAASFAPLRPPVLSLTRPRPARACPRALVVRLRASSGVAPPPLAPPNVASRTRRP